MFKAKAYDLMNAYLTIEVINFDKYQVRVNVRHWMIHHWMTHTSLTVWIKTKI